jgi:diguanylate cyclase (GGDEF)-like protein
VDEAKLSAVLSEFARTLITDFPIQGILDHLVGRIVEVLPVTAAGVTLISTGMAPRYVAASDRSALDFERLQTKLGHGPCLSAYETGQAVVVPHLAGDERFPEFAPEAVAAGLAAVFAFPLRHSAGQLGALDLYRDTPGDLAEHDLTAAQTLADVAAAYLLNAQARDEARATSDRFRHQAMFDVLTGMPNRALLLERLGHAAQRARRSRTNVAVIFVDLDRFKNVNDTHGHHVGDEMLIAVAKRLSTLVRSGDTLARFSGDEFVFLCEDIRAAADVEALAERIGRAFAEPFPLSTGPLVLTASLGIAIAEPGEDISERLVVEADMAMYQVKRNGGDGHQVIDLLDASRVTADNMLETDLRAALAADRLDLAYQPIVRSADGIVVGVEALVRWTHSDRGVVPAASVISIGEQSGLITAIGAWVLERACRDHGRWQHDHPDVPLDLAVNVSARQLISHDFFAMVADVLATTRMTPKALILEMTENVFIESVRAMKVLEDLKAIGLRLSLDDFGTGYSSLSYLRRLPFQIVKIDRAFIADIGVSSTGRAVVAAVTNLAHVLGLAVVAEGVETEDQHDEVRAVGCEYSQGYFYGRPMPAAAISALLDSKPKDARQPTAVGSAMSGSR